MLKLLLNQFEHYNFLLTQLNLSNLSFQSDVCIPIYKLLKFFNIPLALYLVFGFSVELFIKIFKAFLISLQLRERLRQASYRIDHRISDNPLIVTFPVFERH